jgi:uncharacterized integral membrane protein (TIGR00698 family)
MTTSIAVNMLVPGLKTGKTLARLAMPMLPGLTLSALVAGTAIELGKVAWLVSNGLSALTVAIVLGMVIGNTFFPRLATSCDAGVAFSKQRLLRLGIVLYGFRLTFQDIGQMGLVGVVVDALMLMSTFALAMLLGTKLFKLDRQTAILIGAGSSICGAAAVMATEPVVRGRADQVVVAVSTVVVFGTLAIFVYPLLYQYNLHWHVFATSPAAFGIYAGSTIHEVAQVVAAAHAVGQDAANTAVIAKMVRVMMLAPFLLILSAWLARGKAALAAEQGKNRGAGSLAIPWFAFVFIGAIALNSVAVLPHGLVSATLDVDTWLLAMAMAALGLTTHLSAIRNAGIRPLLVAMLLFGWLIVGGGLINRWVAALFA